MHIHSTPWSSTGDEKKKNTTSISHSTLWLSDSSNRKYSAGQEVTCTYLHHTTPLFFLSPTSAIFSTAGNTWARPDPWGCSRTLPPAWHGGQQKPAAWVHWRPCWRATLTLSAHIGPVWKTYCYTRSATNSDVGTTAGIHLSFWNGTRVQLRLRHLRVCTFSGTLPGNVCLCFIYTLLRQVLVFGQL